MRDLRGEIEAELGDVYRVEREIGGGGMSRVFLAEERGLQRPVVIKVLPPELAATVSIARFKREILLAARLQHPNIVPLLTAGEVAGLPYYTMPYIAGESLRQRIARDGALDVSAVIRIVRDMASALAYAHESGIVHRDIKPGNVLLSGTAAMVADFGVARALWESSDGDGGPALTHGGQTVGTSTYMSPEQASRGHDVDERTDIYSLGMVAYEMFAGRIPDTRGAAAAAALRARRPAVPARVAELVGRMIETDRTRRQQKASEIVSALDAIAPRQRRTARGVTIFTMAAIALLALAGYMRLRARLALPKTIAVLPFVNRSGDPGDDYFADGMTDDLTGILTGIRGLAVAARSSAFALKGRPLDARAMGESLHVRYVVEATTQRDRARLRITASLIDVATGMTLSMQPYDRELKDVFQVQDELARAIASQLAVSLGADQRLPGTGTASIEAHDRYMKGRWYAARFTKADLDRAMGLLTEAVQIDTTYAAAWAGIGGILEFEADDWVRPRDAYPGAKKAALRALVLDSTLAAAHAVLGAELMWFEWDADSAAKEIARAGAFDPNNEEAFIYRAALELYRGRPDSALKVARQGQRVAPLNPAMTVAACDALQDLGEMERAEAECRRAVALEPSNGETALELATLLGRRGKLGEAAQWAERGTGIPSRQWIVGAQLLISGGRPDSALKLLQRVERESATSYVRPDPVGAAYLRLGDIPDGLRWYARALDERSASMMAYGSGSSRERSFARPSPAVLADPRVVAFAAKVKAARRGL